MPEAPPLAKFSPRLRRGFVILPEARISANDLPRLHRGNVTLLPVQRLRHWLSSFASPTRKTYHVAHQRLGHWPGSFASPTRWIGADDLPRLHRGPNIASYPEASPLAKFFCVSDAGIYRVAHQRLRHWLSSFASPTRERYRAACQKPCHY